jgi:hypothetical protein
VAGPARKAKLPVARPEPTVTVPRAEATQAVPLEPTAAPEPAESSSIVYPKLPPIPEPTLPEPE